MKAIYRPASQCHTPPMHISVRFLSSLIAVLAAPLTATPALAQPAAAPTPAAATAAPYQPNRASRTFTGTFGGRTMRYSATVE